MLVQEMLQELLGSGGGLSRSGGGASQLLEPPDVDTEKAGRNSKEYALDAVAGCVEGGGGVSRSEIVWDRDPFAISDKFSICAVVQMFESLGLVARFSIRMETLRALVVKCRDSVSTASLTAICI